MDPGQFMEHSGDVRTVGKETSFLSQTSEGTQADNLNLLNYYYSKLQETACWVHYLLSGSWEVNIYSISSGGRIMMLLLLLLLCIEFLPSPGFCIAIH